MKYRFLIFYRKYGKTGYLFEVWKQAGKGFGRTNIYGKNLLSF